MNAIEISLSLGEIRLLLDALEYYDSDGSDYDCDAAVLRGVLDYNKSFLSGEMPYPSMNKREVVE